MSKPKIIVLEGVNGCGKTTQINSLKKYFSPRKVLIVAEKNTRIMTAVNAIGGIESFNQMTQALIYLACRSENLSQINNSDAEIVLYDRYFLSTCVYQNLVSSGLISLINLAIESFSKLKPNLTIFLHLNSDASASRVIEREKSVELNKDRLVDAHKQIIHRYEQSIQRGCPNKIVRIDSMQSKDKVTLDILKEVNDLW